MSSKMGTIMDIISQLLNFWFKLCQNINYRKSVTSFRLHKYEKSNNHRDNRDNHRDNKDKRQYDDKCTTKYVFELFKISFIMNYEYLGHQLPDTGCCYQRIYAHVSVLSN